MPPDDSLVFSLPPELCLRIYDHLIAARPLALDPWYLPHRPEIIVESDGKCQQITGYNSFNTGIMKPLHDLVALRRTCRFLSVEVASILYSELPLGIRWLADHPSGMSSDYGNLLLGTDPMFRYVKDLVIDMHLFGLEEVEGSARLARIVRCLLGRWRCEVKASVDYY